MFRPDVTDLHTFYSTPLGMATCRALRWAIRQLLPSKPENTVQQMIGLGYALPYLLPFLEQDKNRIGAVMPAGQGVIHWPRNNTDNLTVLAEETELPFHNQSIDKTLIIHSLEFTDMELFLPELWRILSPGGQALFIVPSRTGCWSRAEKTPFGHGRPYSAMQLEKALKEAFFIPVKTTHALFMPPTQIRGLLHFSRLLERIGHFLSLPFGGVVMVLAEKRVHAPINGLKTPAFVPGPARAAIGLRRD